MLRRFFTLKREKKWIQSTPILVIGELEHWLSKGYELIYYRGEWYVELKRSLVPVGSKLLAEFVALTIAASKTSDTTTSDRGHAEEEHY